MLELAFKLKQFAAGMPSEIREVNTTVTGTVDVDWEIALRRAYGPVAAASRPMRPEAGGRTWRPCRLPGGEAMSERQVFVDAAWRRAALRTRSAT